jgi:sn-glycerol 3-phosphate transport system substrate-binding protein
MRQSRRTFIRLLTTGAAGLLVAACGGSAPAGSGDATAKPTAAATAGESGKVAAPAPAGGAVKVRFWTGLGGQIGQVISEQVAKFNKTATGIEVENVFQQSYNGVQEKFQAALVSGDVPEVVQIEIHATPQFASAGALAPMEPFYSSDPAFNFDDLVPATLLNQRWEGKLYAMPINRSTPVLYYSKRLFREAGLDPDKPPRTWPEFVGVARKLTRGEGAGKVYGFLPAPDWWYFESVVWGQGGELMSQNLKQVTFAKPGAEVLQLWADMVFKEKTGRVITGENAYDLRVQELQQGRCGMQMFSTASLGAIIRGAQEYEIHTAFMPHAEGKQTAVPTGGAAAAIPAKVAPDRQKAAWEFIKWWISTEQGAHFSQSTGYFPIRKTSIELLEKQGYYKERPQYKTTIDQLQFAREAPLTPHWPAIAKEITKGLEALLVNNTPALEALTKAQERAQAIVNG